MKTFSVIALLLSALPGMCGASAADAVTNQPDATVFVYRLHTFNGMARKMTLSLDGTPFGYLPDGRYIKVHVPAGTHNIEDKKAEYHMRFNVDAGKTYYIRAEWAERGFFGFSARFSLASAEAGIADVETLKAADVRR